MRSRFLSILLFVLIATLLPQGLRAGESDETTLELKCIMKALPPLEKREIHLILPEAQPKSILPRLHIKLIPSTRLIYSAAEDEKNTLWIGTESGLISGSPESSEWIVYNTLNGICFNRITKVLPGKDCLFIGASPLSQTLPGYGGLMRRTGKGKGFECFGRREGLVCNSINDLLAYENILYIATKDGLGFFNLNSQKFIYARNGMDVRHLCMDGRYLWMEGSLLLPKSTEIYHFDRDELIFDRYETKKLFLFDRLSSMAKFKDKLWLTGDILKNATREKGEYSFEGLKLYETATGKLTKVTLPPGVCSKWLKIRNAGDRLAFFSDSGFGFYSKGELTFYTISPGESAILPHMIECSPGGNIYLSSPGALVHFSPEKMIRYEFKNSLSDNYITSMATAFDNLWAGTRYGFINRISENGDVTARYYIGDLEVAEIFQSPQKTLYAQCIANEPDAPRFYAYDEDGDRFVPAPDYRGEKPTNYQTIPMKYHSLIDELKLETLEGKSAFIEDRKCFWLSTYGSGIIRIAR